MNQHEIKERLIGAAAWWHTEDGALREGTVVDVIHDRQDGFFAWVEDAQGVDHLVHLDDLGLAGEIR